jgi:hypothetical protein
METSGLFASALSTAYVVTGILFAVAYWPKLQCMLREPEATALSHSLTSELMWTACRLVTLLYVALVAQHSLISMVVALDLMGRLACVSLLMRSRRLTFRPAFGR